MTKANAVVAAIVVLLLAIAASTYIAVQDHGRLASFVRLEAQQRVHTIGERCEATDHQAKVLHNNLPPSHQGEARWFEQSHARCLQSLGKVEARTGTRYKP